MVNMNDENNIHTFTKKEKEPKLNIIKTKQKEPEPIIVEQKKPVFDVFNYDILRKME
jgi:hypothetical protein